MKPPMPSMASAISFDVGLRCVPLKKRCSMKCDTPAWRSSSPGPSAPAFTNAIAFRIRSAAARPGMGSAGLGLAGSDHDAPIRLLADARAADVGVVLQREVDGASLERLHGIERDRVAGH